MDQSFIDTMKELFLTANCFQGTRGIPFRKPRTKHELVLENMVKNTKSPLNNEKSQQVWLWFDFLYF